MPNYPKKYRFTDKLDFGIRLISSALMSLLFVVLDPIEVGNGELGRDWLFVFLLISTIWQVNILFIDVIEKLFCWDKYLRLKIFIDFSFALFWPTVVHYFFNITVYTWFFGAPCDLSEKENFNVLLITIMITFTINALYTASSFYEFWMHSVKEKENIIRERSSAEFETLKNQINPHFLFNSINTLTVLIEEKSDLASEFVRKLSAVYRYVLNQKEKNLVPLSEEIAFLESYVYLNHIRFGNNFKVEIDIPKEYENQYIITLSAQMLLENCIKHNVISEKHPLNISLSVKNKKLEVRNNLQRKNQNKDSNGIGLNNIIQRYKLVTNETVTIEDNDHEFLVSLPILKTAL